MNQWYAYARMSRARWLALGALAAVFVLAPTHRAWAQG